MSDPTRTQTAPEYPSTATILDAVSTTAGGPTRRDGDSPFDPRDQVRFVPPGFELGNEVGRGGMGLVFLARDVELNREVAVKILRPKYAPGSATAKRFVDEAQITSQLQHPGIPPVYRVGSLPDGRPFLAMKLIKGQTLAELLKEQGPGSTRWLGVFEGICQAVGYAHAHRVIHRDLKPTNVMVGAFGEVQVMDWGLAKVLEASRERERPEDSADPGATADPTAIKSLRDADLLTQYGSVLGTPAFMAPEQAIGAVKQIDRRTDVFGLGAILCSLLSGKPPYVGDSVESTRQLAAGGKLDDAFSRLDSCGAEPELVSLCKRCLSAVTNDRPADASAVAEAVAAFRTAADERARRAEIDREKAEVESYEQKKRRRVVQWAGGITAAVLLAGVVGTTIGMVQVHESKEAEKRRADGEKAAKEREAEQREIAEQKRSEAEAATQAEKAAKEREAEQRAKAEKAYTKTADVLDVMVSAITGDSLATQKAISREQKKFLAEVLTYYREFAGAKGDDETTRSRTARAAHRVGQIEYQLGRADEAAAAFHTALDGYAALTADYPKVPFYRQEQAGMCNELGLLLARLGKWAPAEEQHRRALGIREKLADDFPAEAAYRRDVARSYNNLGNVLADQDKQAEAAEVYRHALDVQKKLADDFPALPVYRSDLAGTHNNLGLVLAKLGEGPKAEEQYQKALVIREKLADEYPAEADYRRDVARTHNSLGVLHFSSKQWAKAEQEYRKGLAAHEKLATDFPAVPMHQVELGGGYCNFGHMLRESGNPAGSLDWFRKAIDTLRPVHERDSRYVSAKQFLRNSHSGRATSYDRLLQFAEAVKDWDRVVELTPKEEQPFYRACRAASRMNAGQVAEAVAEVAELARASDWSADNWYAFAQIFALASVKIPDKDIEYAERAIELLNKAVIAGYKDAAQLASDKAFGPLRERDNFKKLLADLEKKYPPKKEVLPPPRMG